MKHDFQLVLFHTCCIDNNSDQLIIDVEMRRRDRLVVGKSHFQDRLVDAEDYSSSSAKLTWRLLSKVLTLLLRILPGHVDGVPRRQASDHPLIAVIL